MSITPITDEFPHTFQARVARPNRVNVDETQEVVRRLTGDAHVLAPLIAGRVEYVLHKTFPHEEILCRKQGREYSMGRAWLGFFLRHHPHCFVNGAPSSLGRIGGAMKRDHTTILYAIKTVIARMKDARFSKELYQLSYIATALEIEHDWGAFNFAPFLRIERMER